MYTNLKAINDDVSICKSCELCKTRKNTVFGEGNPSAKIMFVGEGPGLKEDELGRPFVGKAGQL
jgi:DNA polymerase